MVEPSCDKQMVDDGGGSPAALSTVPSPTSLQRWEVFKQYNELARGECKSGRAEYLAQMLEKSCALENGTKEESSRAMESPIPWRKVCSTSKKEILLRDMAMFININIDGGVAVEPYDKVVNMNRWIAYGCLGKIADMLIDVEPANRDEITEFGKERVLPLHSDVNCMVNVAWSSVKDIYYDFMIAKRREECDSTVS